MPRRRAPVPELRRALSHHEALDLGISRGRLASPALQHPFWGVVRERRLNVDEAEFAQRCHDYAARMPRHQFFSHGTALRLHGAPVPFGVAEQLHVATHRPAREPRTRGITGHRLQARDDAAGVVDGLRVEHPVRAWRQAGASWGALALTQAGDFLLARRRPLATIEELRAEVATMGGTPALRRALTQVRVGSESPRETELRLILVAAGLPEPELNVDIRVGGATASGRFVARLDLFYRRYGVAVEYDGRQHAADARQFARDADRWDAIRDADVTLVRILDHHLADGGRAAVAKVRAALRRRGYPR
ncbi:hypothetical protein M4I32_09220 [Microbacterium sp. LRZ72]|uniref:hypothetical protein n=1 Tax=Microbacterium sp. LRZ72 TaxID=2942481 RepID=UPI0029A5363F|nr:hypothetical protein [Microbacterium sp. LRZ72]MDX2376976.1 hypothetical protein [Microbacterium sp. LRZ72]